LNNFHSACKYTAAAAIVKAYITCAFKNDNFNNQSPRVTGTWKNIKEF